MSYLAKIAILICAFSLLSFGAGAQTPAAPPAKKPATPAAHHAGPFDPALLQPATLKARAPAEYEVKFVTTAGDFTVQVTRAWAPNGADRFYNLVRHHFYDGAAFFRVLPGFMAQFGISAVSASVQGLGAATIKDDPIVQSNHRGFHVLRDGRAEHADDTSLYKFRQ